MLDRLNQSIAHIEIPSRMRNLPLSPRGYPVPWFVGWVDGLPDFRTFDTDKMRDAVAHGKCMLCGQLLGRFHSYVVGPMCIVNRTSAEPPSHRECGLYAITACPFLTNPAMRRNEKEMPEDATKPGGIMIPRNPGVTVLWTTRHPMQRMRDGRGGFVFHLPDPQHVQFFARGQPASRDEVLASIESGLPILRDMANRDRDPKAANDALFDMLHDAMKWVPA